MRFCESCGTGHECEAGGEGRTDPAVEIARINAKRDVEIARMEYREALELAAVEADTAVVVTEMETAADIAVAEETEPPVLPDSSDDGNQSIIVEGPPAEDAPEDAPPPAEGSEPPAPGKHKASGIGMW